MKPPEETPNSWLDDVASADIQLKDGHITVVEETPQEQKRHWLRNRTTITLLVVLAVVVVGWLAASFYMPKVKIGTQLVPAQQSDAYLQNLITKQAGAYKLAIAYPDKTTKQYSLATAGMRVNAPVTVANIRHETRKLANRMRWWRSTQAYLAVQNDNSKLYDFIAQQASVTIQPAKDASLALDNGTVKLTDSTLGKKYGLSQPQVSLNAAASTLQTVPLRLKVLSTRPTITAKQLSPYQAMLKKILSQSVSFKIDTATVQASPTDIADWIELTPPTKAKPVDITINSGKVLSYINKISASAAQPPKAQIEVAQADGSTTVLVKGINGTSIIDNDTVASQVAANLLKNQPVQQTLTTKYALYKTISAQAYPKWIEVDTTNKRMYAYEQSSLARTFLVSAGAPATPTVTGQYAIYSKYVSQNMLGENVDGSSYFQPNVAWVNYFYKDYAIHGNYWRPTSYFGNINSSHGCVGIVDSDAQWVYNWAPIGTPVIVHT
jgi:lipoprotein-anchoring transpeptidase ErfK/SrfK